ncbi:MAG: family transcriptional regulator, cyclic receptor protein [Acidobacteriota bacterium]|nr:family transcriptional regulator, cyclic receptor protein [Acidobacteriota bacterium]
MSQSIIESELATSETPRRFAPGETLFREGDDANGVFIMQSGEVDLIFSPRNGEPKALRGVQPGQVLGLSCVVTHRPHDCTATARTECETAFVRRDDFLRKLDERPATWFSVLRFLSSDVNAAYDDIRAMSAR